MDPGLELRIAPVYSFQATAYERVGAELAALDQTSRLFCSESKSFHDRLSIIGAPMVSRHCDSLNIVVVGAGPVGTVAALACARLGHRVTLLEAEDRVNDAPRASTTQPPTLEILEQL